MVSLILVWTIIQKINKPCVHHNYNRGGGNKYGWLENRHINVMKLRIQRVPTSRSSDSDKLRRAGILTKSAIPLSRKLSG